MVVEHFKTPELRETQEEYSLTQEARPRGDYGRAPARNSDTWHRGSNAKFGEQSLHLFLHKCQIHKHCFGLVHLSL
jgi:hypothetical protein